MDEKKINTSQIKLAADLLRGIKSNYPILYVQGWEEDRLENLLLQIANRRFGEGSGLKSWSSTNGFGEEDGGSSRYTDPMQALEYIASKDQPGFYWLKDFPLFWDRNPLLVRAIRDLYYQLKNKNIYVILSHPLLLLPEVLKKEVFLVKMASPDETEILLFLKKALLGYPGNALQESDLHQFAVAMLGLSLNEVGHLFTRVMSQGGQKSENVLKEIQAEKSQMLSKESCLRFVAEQTPLNQIGGLDNLKQWMLDRKNLFTADAFASGIPLPSGILLMGVSGCGKSMAAKAVAAAWGVQLVRLDMSLVASGAYGPPETAFEHAISIAEEVAPLVLWIDELENAFGFDDHAQGAGNISIFSSFLTWMQEKSPRVFVAATANRIESIPAELMRKGRFDQLFFLDLPTKKERAEILGIHLEKNAAVIKEFDISYLATATKAWSGAEIEAAVNTARVVAYQHGEAINQVGLAHAIAQMVPLSHTMSEQIKAIKNWSFNRAAKASVSD